ncbi:hypothetical protein MSAN_02290200 [Mycena sanguinolenta]|uniref:F-box domain-containing protein n=1 Tax=Mycena sanguinolenta TaxID=230812 RepID=A0A8H7CGK3_9AGAR|nr:hypothetical protein MSAN_02290200 [Mycena sanguinolenta]
MRSTRGAVREADKIPNEILTEMFTHAPRAVLARICRTTKRYRAVATPLLYRTVANLNLLELETWVETMVANSELSPHVWYFEISGTRGLCEEAAIQLTTVVAQLHNLRILNVVGDLCRLGGKLCSASFKQLHTIRCTAMRSTSTCLATFLNRQEAVSTLTMDCTSRQPRPFEALIQLPKLTSYRGESMFLPDLHDSSMCGLTVAHLWAWTFDIEWEPLMERFGRFSVLRDLTADVCRVKGSAALEAIAKHLPRIEAIKIRAKGPRRDERRPDIGLAEVPHALGPFQALNSLSFEHFPPRGFDTHTTVTVWGASCPTLQQIGIAGTIWCRAGAHWEQVVSSEADGGAGVAAGESE